MLTTELLTTSTTLEPAVDIPGGLLLAVRNRSGVLQPSKSERQSEDLRVTHTWEIQAPVESRFEVFLGNPTNETMLVSGTVGGVSLKNGLPLPLSRMLTDLESSTSTTPSMGMLVPAHHAAIFSGVSYQGRRVYPLQVLNGRNYAPITSITGGPPTMFDFDTRNQVILVARSGGLTRVIQLTIHAVDGKVEFHPFEQPADFRQGRLGADGHITHVTQDRGHASGGGPGSVYA